MCNVFILDTSHRFKRNTNVHQLHIFLVPFFRPLPCSRRIKKAPHCPCTYNIPHYFFFTPASYSVHHLDPCLWSTATTNQQLCNTSYLYVWDWKCLLISLLVGYHFLVTVTFVPFKLSSVLQWPHYHPQYTGTIIEIPPPLSSTSNPAVDGSSANDLLEFGVNLAQ